MEFEEQAAGITQGMTFGISTPQRRSLGEAVGAGRGNTIVLIALRSAGTFWTGRGYAAEPRLWGRIGRGLRSSLHGLVMAKLNGIGG